MKLYQTIQGEMIDAICYNIFGYESGFLEEVLEMNPGIAALDDYLPAGTFVKLLEKPAIKNERLWHYGIKHEPSCCDRFHNAAIFLKVSFNTENSRIIKTQQTTLLKQSKSDRRGSRQIWIHPLSNTIIAVFWI